MCSDAIEIEYNPYKGKIVPKTNELIEKRTLFTRNQERLFSVVLRELQYEQKDGAVYLDTSKVSDYLGYTSKNSFDKLREDLSGMKDKSSMKFLDEQSRRYWDISVIIEVEMNSDKIMVQFNPKILQRLTDLSKKYTKYFQDDFCGFKSKASMKLYERLMELHVYADRGVLFTTEQLFDIFCLEKNAYKDSHGNFQRTNFEKRTLVTAVNEINATTKCIENLAFERVKRPQREVFYLLTYDYISPEA